MRGTQTLRTERRCLMHAFSWGALQRCLAFSQRDRRSPSRLSRATQIKTLWSDRNRTEAGKNGSTHSLTRESAADFWTWFLSSLIKSWKMLHVVGHTREKSLRFNPQNCEKSPDMRVHRGSIREMRWSPFCCIQALWTLLITALIITFWRVWWLTETTEYHKVRRPWPEDTWLMCGCDSLRGWRRGVDSWRMMMWQRWSDVTTPCRFIILKQPPRENGVRFKTDENKVGRWQTEEKLHANVATGSTLGEPSSTIKT